MAATVRAQYDVSFAHYWAMEPSFNPAAVGKEAKLNVTGAYALQLAGFEHNPKTMYAAADMQLYGLGTYHGVGVQLLNDDIGLFSHKRLAVQYAYQRRVVKGKLSVGVQLGMLGETFDGSKAEMPEDGSDPILSSSSINGSGLDVSAGIYYQALNWYMGASVLHLNNPVVALGETSELSIDATYYFTAGYNIQLNHPFFKIQTSVLGRTDGGVEFYSKVSQDPWPDLLRLVHLQKDQQEDRACPDLLLRIPCFCCYPTALEFWNRFWYSRLPW